jgi:hypothetical protein
MPERLMARAILLGRAYDLHLLSVLDSASPQRLVAARKPLSLPTSSPTSSNSSMTLLCAATPPPYNGWRVTALSIPTWNSSSRQREPF